MKNKLVLILMLLLLISSLLIIVVPIAQINATPSLTGIREVRKAGRLTNSNFYDRNPSFFIAQDGTYWLFYTEGENPTTPGYDPDNDTYDIYYMISSDNGTTWPTLSLLDLSDPWPSERDVAAFQSSNGTIWVFSGSGFGPGSDNVLRYYTYDSTTWTGPTLVTSGGSNVTGGHVDAFEGSAGRIWVFYEKSGPHTYAIYTDDGGASWSAEVKVNSGSVYGGVPKAFKDSSEMLNVVYTNNGNGIYRANSTDGITWTQSATPIANNSVYDYDPTLCQDSNGTYWLFWAPWDQLTDSQWVECEYSLDGITWSDSIHITSGGYGTNYWWDMWPEAHLKPNGDMLLFYTSEVANGSYVKGDGNIWMFEVVWNLTNQHYEFIQNAINAAGPGDTINVAAGTYNEQVRFTKPVTVTSFTGEAVSGEVVINPNGAEFEGPVSGHMVRAAVTFEAGSSGSVLRGVIIENSNASDYTPENYGGNSGIEVIDAGIDNVVVQNVNVNNVAGHGFGSYDTNHPWPPPSGWLIDNCTFSTTDTDTWSGMRPENMDNLTIQDCDIGPTNYGGILLINVNDIVVQRNKVHNTIRAGIQVDSYCTGVIDIINNEVWATNNANAADYGDVRLYGQHVPDPHGDVAATVTIQGNLLHDGFNGLCVKTGQNISTRAVVVHKNNIWGHSNYGILNAGIGTLDATYNWWGNETGPYHPITNPSGTGDNVSDSVDYKPWLIEPYPPAVPAPELYVDSVTIESPSYGKNFTTDVKLANVTDLYGFEFKLYWNTTLLDLVDVNVTPPWIEHTLGTNQINETIGRYWVGVSALGPSPSFNGSTTLVALTFKITYVPVYPENVNCTFDLNETTLGDPDGKSIPHIVYDGEYMCYAARTKIQVLPQVSEAKALHQVFNLSINVANVANLHTFEFELQYNTTLLDAKEITVTSFSDRTYKVSKKMIDDTQGLVTLRVESISPPLQVNESLELASITFEVTNATTWRKPSIESDFSFGPTQLITDTEAVDHDKIGGLYRYRPIPGDINSDGTVNIMDLAIVARAYGTKPGDPKWNELVDVNNDNIINILDLIPVARNYGRTD